MQKNIFFILKDVSNIYDASKFKFLSKEKKYKFEMGFNDEMKNEIDESKNKDVPKEKIDEKSEEKKSLNNITLSDLYNKNLITKSIEEI